MNHTNESNRVSIITFSTDSTILTPFTNDKDLVLSKLDVVATDDSTNYNAALLNVDEVMSDYVKEPNRDVVMLFLTDGYPNKDTSNQIGTYTILKDKYPYMDINGIQYEMGKRIINDLEKNSDSQWATDQDNLHNVLLEASISPQRYEKFILTDYIDNRYYNVDSANDIKVSVGSVSFTNNKITWNLSHKYVMGEDITMTIKMSLKSAYTREEGLYPTNTQTFKISGEKEEKTWDETTGPDLIGKYTYKLTVKDGTCSTIYYIGEYVNTTNALVFNIDANSHYSQFGDNQTERIIIQDGKITRSERHMDYHPSPYHGVRPVISLAPGIEYIDGDGSRERPYYIETE